MQKTKIEWCDRTWNPVTGCLHDCPYCYARKIARRFAAKNETINGCIYDIKKGCDSSYPYGFNPTLHRYRLDEPSKIKKPQNIFVCSMADLFGEWVPDEWINAVFEACKKSPQHRYLFLTKNGKRFRMFKNFHADNIWFGQTLTGIEGEFLGYSSNNTFLSIEPLLGGFRAVYMWKHFGWIIIGAETGNRKDKIIPKREWIEPIVEECRRTNTPVFMKNDLRDIWKEPLIQEYPWDNKEADDA